MNLAIVKKYIVMMQRSGFLFFNADSGEKTEIVYDIPPDLVIPYVPVCGYIWEEHERSPYNFAHTEMVKKIQKLLKRILKPQIFFVASDDFIEIDTRSVKEFFLKWGAREVLFLPQNIFLSKDSSYVSITQSCRAWILSYIKDSAPVAKKYVDVHSVSADDLQRMIKTLHPDCEYTRLPVYSNVPLDGNWATVIDDDKMFENSRPVTEKNAIAR